MPEWLYQDPLDLHNFDCKQLTVESFNNRYADINPVKHLRHLGHLVLPSQALPPSAEQVLEWISTLTWRVLKRSIY